jgi:general secretion pathway protein A
MYESYFGFSEYPFENNLDPRFLFISEVHKEVLAALSYFIKIQKGFAIVCGDVGTGKTMLINSFLNTLPEYIQPINVANPGVSSLELLRYIAKTMKIEVDEKDDIPDLIDAVKGRLINAKGLNKQFVLIIDEAHLLSDQALETIRLLANIEIEDQKLLQILLVGQYELSHKLDRPEMRHLRQRININRFLSPMSSFETRQYVDHRLRQVGSSFSTIFEDNCGSAIYKMTGGVPRNINQLCDNALLICMSEQQQKVQRRCCAKPRKPW